MPPTSKQTQTDFESLFANLEVTPSEEPLPVIQRTRASIPNPFGGPLRASVEHGTPYSIHVPADAVQRAVSLINSAARKENLGVRVVVNVRRDDKGQLVKGDDGKAVPIVEQRGEHKGKVLIRFQGSAERKQTAPRPFTIVKDPDNAPDGRMLKERASGQIVARGTHDEMRTALKARKDGNA